MDESAVKGQNESTNAASVKLDSSSSSAVPSIDGESSKPFTPSQYQSDIFDFVRDQTENAVVEAVAGSGKTTTLVKALEFTPDNLNVGFVAFNKHIATELQRRAPDHVHVSTLHSLGYSNIRRSLGKVRVDDKKLWNLFDEMTSNLPDMVKDELQQDASAMIQLVNLCKGILKEPNQSNLDYLCNRYAIEIEGEPNDIYEMVGRMLDRSRQQTNVIDFEDMIDFCARGQVACERFDVLFCDESQDFSPAQVQMAIRSGERVIAVGDRWQSIYGFRGADTEAIPNLIRELDAKTLPLSISYRCPRLVVEKARTIVPQIEYRPDAPDGKIADMAEAEFYRQVKQGDLVLCRTNAPLVKPCFEMIRRHIKATIRGRDIGKGLIQFLERFAKKSHEFLLRDILREMAYYVDRECDKSMAANKETRAQSLRDQYDTLLALSDGCWTIADVTSKVETIFSDDATAIQFSSVHRAKGCESDRVFVLRPDLMPHPLGMKQAWSVQQERNLQYVCWTRAKSELNFVYSQ